MVFTNRLNSVSVTASTPRNYIALFTVASGSAY
jgi:hypothetical protein